MSFVKRLIPLVLICCAWQYGLGQVRIDHVITLTPDLETTIQRYENMGFTIKHGTLHDNGLKNAHIKFSNSSAIEIMTVVGEPGNALAESYASLLIDQPGGVYVALTAPDQETIESQLRSIDIPYEVTPGKLWTYITFPQPELAHFFFIFYVNPKGQDRKYSVHSNGIEKISEIKVDGNKMVVKLLTAVAMPYSKKNPHTFITLTGNITLFPHQDSLHRPRILEMICCSFDNNECLNLKLKQVD